jgi:hypothetical protein
MTTPPVWFYDAHDVRCVGFFWFVVYYHRRVFRDDMVTLPIKDRY